MPEKILSLSIGIILSALTFFSGCDVNDSDGFRETFSYQIMEQSVIKTDTMQRSFRQDSSITVLNFSVESGWEYRIPLQT